MFPVDLVLAKKVRVVVQKGVQFETQTKCRQHHTSRLGRQMEMALSSRKFMITAAPSSFTLIKYQYHLSDFSKSYPIAT